MKKTNLLLIIFLLLASNMYAQKKTFATKIDAETFLIDNIKKAPFDYYKFDSYDKGVILFKNEEIEEIDEDDLKDDDGKDVAYATPNAKQYKCNKYVKVYLNRVEKIRIDTLKSFSGEPLYKYIAIGNKVLENGYMPTKTKNGFLKKYLNEFPILDTELINSNYGIKSDLLMSDDKVLQAEFLEAVKVYCAILSNN